MNLTVAFDLADRDKAVLLRVLGVADADLQGVLQLHAQAALQEYVDCYVGRRASSRGADILEHRLALLVRIVFEGRAPTAAQVADLLQLSTTRAASLIKTTFSRYRIDLEDVTSSAIKRALETARWADGTEVHLQLTAPGLTETIDKKLLSGDAGFKQIRRARGALGVYAIEADAYAALCAVYGAVAVPAP